MLSSNGQALVYLGNMIINFKRKRDESPVQRNSEPNGPGADMVHAFLLSLCQHGESLEERKA